MAKRFYRMKLITLDNLMSCTASEQLVYKTVERIAQQNNITMPEVGIYESPEVNAFATGAMKNSSLVAASS